ncbi:hypothetical protein GCM10010096_06250 [Alcaligenes pakistanensis]|uniref:MarR family transcriptional regulator n=2 Tax=Alcaligenes pakistanensis TaxID=1482717 RepID=A0A8H9IGS0_9BURK|nr:hypothetical protein GCM10010096_06250 [Alcaligenes pakistanensis]
MVAESMGMTRQGAQKRLNKLAEDNLVNPLLNPRHDRSPIWELSPKGAETYKSIMSRYEVWLQMLLPKFESTNADFLSTSRLLLELENALKQTDIQHDVLSAIPGKPKPHRTKTS